jgi:hypothetical protein
MRDAIARLRDLPLRVHLVCTGAGAGAQGAIWAVPGCSSFFAGASFPYAADQTSALLGFVPEHYCDPSAAIDLAMAAYMRAFDPMAPHKEPVGVGVTASVASLEEHRGEHRVHVAAVTRKGVLAKDLVLPKDKGVAARARDGALADGAAIAMLLSACGVVPDEGVRDATQLAHDRLFARPWFTSSGIRRPLPSAFPDNVVLFPGAFNPPHDGHFAIEAALDHRGADVIFAITTDPPHKPALSVALMLERARMLEGHARVFTRGDPLYLDKARRFPGVPIVIGADALVRMLDPKWGVEPVALLRELADLGSKFHVFGRLVDGAFVTWADAIAHVPEAHRTMFVGTEGRWDKSSTAERETLTKLTTAGV